MKLIDFGCAKVVSDTEFYKDMAGTPYYISPEVLEPTFPRTGKILKAADMWSMGAFRHCKIRAMVSRERLRILMANVQHM